MKRLIIVRHGNTFLPNQMPTRVGRRTDLPLVENDLAKRIGNELAAQGMRIDAFYAAPLKRTTQTAQLIADEMGLTLPIKPLPQFLEIDYGPDENKTEDAVITRLGREALTKQGHINPSCQDIIAAGNTILSDWNENSVVPSGWEVDPASLIHMWRHFANAIPEGETALVVSSNGVIRFAPHLLSDKEYAVFRQHHELKVKTGSMSVFDYDKGKWACKVWNERPEERQ